MDDATAKMTLADLGFDIFFGAGRKELGLADYALARITAEYKNAYRVKGSDGEYFARITGVPGVGHGGCGSSGYTYHLSAASGK